MGQEDIERLRAGYAAFNEGGVGAILDLLTADITVRDRESLPDRSTHHGLLGIAQVFQSTMEAFDQLRLEPEEFIEVDDNVVAVLRQYARGRGSGAEVEGKTAHVWTMLDGKAVALRIFRDKERALEALSKDRNL